MLAVIPVRQDRNIEHPTNQLYKREKFAISLRKQKKKTILRSKRANLISKGKQQLYNEN